MERFVVVHVVLGVRGFASCETFYFTTFAVVVYVVLSVHGFASWGLGSGSMQVSFSCDFICVILTSFTAFTDVFTENYMYAEYTKLFSILGLQFSTIR